MLQNGRRPIGHWSVLVNFLSEKIGLIREQDFSPFNLSQIKYLGGHFFCSHTRRIGRKGVNRLSKCGCLLYYVVENCFFVWLERQVRYFGLPFTQILKLGTGGVSRDLNAPIANWTGVVVNFLNPSSSYLQALPVIPGKRC